MVCPNCGVKIEENAFFCDGCGCRIRRKTSDDGSRETPTAQSKYKITNKRIYKWWLVAVGVLAIAVLIVGIVLILKRFLPNIMPSAASDSESSDVQREDSLRADWEAPYRVLLEQLIPERMGSLADGNGIQMALVDLNFDGIPELIDYVYTGNASDDRYIDVYYIENGCTRLLGTTAADRVNKQTLQLCQDRTTGNKFFVSKGSNDTDECEVGEIYVWGMEGLEQPYCECLFLTQRSADKSVLMTYADESFIEFDESESLYCVYTYCYGHVSGEDFFHTLTAFENSYSILEWQIPWYIDGYAAHRDDGVLQFEYADSIHAGATATDAATTVVQEIVEAYSLVE